MKRSVAQTNQKLVDRLRSGLNLRAVQSALDRGEITHRQAQNIGKLIRTAKEIRANYGYSAVVFDEASNQYVGEIVSKNRGASWIGRRYGRNYPRDSAEFAQEDDAVRFVNQVSPQTVMAEITGPERADATATNPLKGSLVFEGDIISPLKERWDCNAIGQPRRIARHRTGRNQQFNIKATADTIERFYKLADKRRVALGELLEQGLDALEKSAGTESPPALRRRGWGKTSEKFKGAPARRRT